MKILFDHPNPFLLTHGGFEIQIEQTKEALQKIGVEVENLRWWDSNQSGDVIHFFGRPHSIYIKLAHAKGIKVVIAELLSGLSARPALARFVQRIMIFSAEKVLPAPFVAKLAWDSYKHADACIALNAWERSLMIKMFRARPERVHVVPNGVEPVFTNSPKVEREGWLLCTATITERKRVVELAEAAVVAQIRLRIIGRPYSEHDPYYLKFLDLNRLHSDLIWYDGGIENRQQLAIAYRKAHGFVLLSTMESLSLSALEAAACECPLLLSDLPWARTTFGNNASYCSANAPTAETARALRKFYDSAPASRLPEKPKSWIEIASDLKRIYELVCKTS
jgi:glycosyltransferase involved in cell wall biosynthesis